MATTNGHTNGNGIATLPKITLYTNHRCPYAHRAHIALKELDIPYEEVIIDLDTPREPWYLKVNPRGLVPSIKFGDGDQEQILYESQVVAQFLADAAPSSLAPSSQSDPLFRARLNFFMDTWNTKISSFMYPALKGETMAAKEETCKQWVAAIEKEIEPLLKGANPFFGGSKELTLAEVHTAPFLLRFYALANGELLPTSFKDSLNKLPNFGPWANATMAKESVTYIWDEESIVKTTASRIAKLKSQAK